MNCTLEEGRRLEKGIRGKKTWRLEIVRGVGEGIEFNKMWRLWRW